MVLRITKKEDVNRIMDIINEGKISLKNSNVDQWQNGYPNEDVILKDIDNGESFVLEYNNEIIGTTALSFRGEKTYDNIYEGKWISNGKYAVIHRIAVAKVEEIKSVGSEILKEAEKICLLKNIKNIKIDTHEDNKAMQGLLLKNKYEHCGVIYLEDGSKRIAFEKELL
ncbi:GNAT family N-acetyltransferase [Clostridium nigeriense]|uniref:GNAT family N-acetyltransferase n=1 Tax=Clostridium nigeriense TaxID=1805470 RepID=UPI00082A601E|nr:GNAT family N-acetyltransferase [Clostridium nigeriense]